MVQPAERITRKNQWAADRHSRGEIKVKIQSINECNTNFKMNFKLSDETLKLISKSTRLSIDELHQLPMDEATRLMKERGAIKEPNKFKEWLSNMYIRFGEFTGLIKKQRKILTHDKILYI